MTAKELAFSNGEFSNGSPHNCLMSVVLLPLADHHLYIYGLSKRGYTKVMATETGDRLTGDWLFCKSNLGGFTMSIHFYNSERPSSLPSLPASQALPVFQGAWDCGKCPGQDHIEEMEEHQFCDLLWDE